jgi:ankyrin repeat protein
MNSNTDFYKQKYLKYKKKYLEIKNKQLGGSNLGGSNLGGSNLGGSSLSLTNQRQPRSVINITSNNNQDNIDRQLEDEINNVQENLQNVEKLLKDGANPNKKNDAGNSIIMEAIQRGKTKTVELLLNFPCSMNNSLLKQAIEMGNIDITNLLLDKCSNSINLLVSMYKDNTFMNTLLSNIEMVTLLLNKGLNLYQVDNDGTSLMNIATNQKRLDIVQLLLNLDQDPMQTDKYCICLLHDAVMIRDNEDIIRALLDKGANPNQVDKFGNTPLHFAVLLQNNQENIKLLLMEGALMNTKNKKSTDDHITKIINKYNTISDKTKINYLKSSKTAYELARQTNQENLQILDDYYRDNVTTWNKIKRTYG